MPARPEIVRWIAHEILPHEADVRRWLVRRVDVHADADEIIQHAYCRLAELDYVGHVRSGRRYFFATARSILLERIRRSQIVEFRAMTDLDESSIMDDSPSPERIAGGRMQLQHVLDLLDRLPAAYRDVLLLRRLEGLSQKEAAARLGVSENVVENNVARGLRMLLHALGEQGVSLSPDPSAATRRTDVPHR
ncbi:sigma-70 family RNA polymerase sigma factor [Croceibacterium sp. TMG7-5b_MA50]|uniref:RNA polymerase sigma factor n=1 Tax=Croceibacterium sp. TMG7-5b_MA50 TaxID=3121290 RepID=UPI003221FF93